MTTDTTLTDERLRLTGERRREIREAVACAIEDDFVLGDLIDDAKAADTASMFYLGEIIKQITRRLRED